MKADCGHSERASMHPLTLRVRVGNPISEPVPDTGAEQKVPSSVHSSDGRTFRTGVHPTVPGIRVNKLFTSGVASSDALTQQEVSSELDPRHERTHRAGMHPTTSGSSVDDLSLRLSVDQKETGDEEKSDRDGQ